MGGGFETTATSPSDPGAGMHPAIPDADYLLFLMNSIKLLCCCCPAIPADPILRAKPCANPRAETQSFRARFYAHRRRTGGPKGLRRNDAGRVP